MPDLIPATPGWYLEGRDEDGRWLEPVIAWKAATNANGEDILLPFVPEAPGFPPALIDVKGFDMCTRHIVYRPDHDPATDA